MLACFRFALVGEKARDKSHWCDQVPLYANLEAPTLSTKKISDAGSWNFQPGLYIPCSGSETPFNAS